MHTSDFLLLVQNFFLAKISAAIHPRREKIHFQNPAKKKKNNNENWGGKWTKKQKKSGKIQ